MTLYSRGNARRSLIDTITLRAVSQVFTLLGYIVLVRGMSEESFGVFSLLYAFVPVVGTVASFGLEQVLRRYQPEYLRQGNRAAAAWLTRVIARARLWSNIVVFGLILLGWNYVAPLFQLTPHRTAFAAFGLVVLLIFQASVLQGALGSYMQHRHAVGAAVLTAFVKLVAYLALVWQEALTLEAAIAVETLAHGAGYLWLRIAYRRCVADDPGYDYRIDPVERKRLVRYGLLSNFNDAGVLLLYGTLDNFLLAAFVSTTAVGIYSFYGRLKLMVTGLYPVRLFENVIRPLFFAVPVADAGRRIPQYFSFLLNMSLAVQWPALAFSIAYHAEIVTVVFGGKFLADSWLLPTIMSFGLLNTISEPASLVAHYEEKAGMLLLSKLFAFVNIAALFALVPIMGIYGAALAAGTSQLLKNAFIWWRVRRLAIWVNARLALPIALVAWVGGAGICIGLERLANAPAAVDLVVGVLVFAAIGALYLRTDAISASDRMILTALTPKKAMRVLRLLGLSDDVAQPPTAA